MKKMWHVMAMTAICILWYSCTDDGNHTITEPSGPAKDYSERLVSVADPEGNAQGLVTLRFYQDMPHVAYVSIRDFQRMMYPGTTVEVQKTASHQYALTSPCGTAMVDIEKDFFESDDYEAFTNLMGQVQPGMPNVTFDALPIIRWKSLEAEPQQVHVTFDYGKYGIDIREDHENVYFPFATLADLYTDVYMHLAAFNGQSVMVAPNGAYSLLHGYPESFITPILCETRPSDMAAFNYKNLCFTLTNFFGYPGRTLLEKSMKEKGLDQALQDYGPAGRMTRELLQSTNMYDFISGTATLGCLLDDGGHTYTDISAISKMSGDSTFVATLNPIKKAKIKEFDGYCPEYQPFRNDNTERKALRKDLNAKREEIIGKGVRYAKVGHTAYCLFDEFFCDDSGWKKFYQGKGAKPTIEEYPDDYLIILIDALEEAQNDPEVKNFIIDISTNGGGSTDIVVFMASLICNKPYILYDNALTGQKMKCEYEVDRNLDGKFDEKDNDVKIDLNVGIIISGYSFSCANILPSIMKDNGICLIGQPTAGGACCVLFNPSAEGFGYRYSTNRARSLNEKGENIDAGIKPDYELTNLDDFFDIAKIGQLIDDFYTK